MNAPGWLLVALLALPGSNDSHKVEMAYESLKACSEAQALLRMQHEKLTGPNASSACIPMPAMQDTESKDFTEK